MADVTSIDFYFVVHILYNSDEALAVGVSAGAAADAQLSDGHLDGVGLKSGGAGQFEHLTHYNEVGVLDAVELHR